MKEQKKSSWGAVLVSFLKEFLLNSFEAPGHLYYDENLTKMCIRDRYNREWHRKTKIPLKWIEGAGHNSNTDKPEMINSLIEEFLSNIL